MYPGNVTEAVQLAWEAWTPDHPPLSDGRALVEAALRHGLLLPSQLGEAPRIASLGAAPQVYLRLEWTADIAGLWRVVLRCACTVHGAAASEDPAAFHTRAGCPPDGRTPAWRSAG